MNCTSPSLPPSGLRLARFRRPPTCRTHARAVMQGVALARGPPGRSSEYAAGIGSGPHRRTPSRVPPLAGDGPPRQPAHGRRGAPPADAIGGPQQRRGEGLDPGEDRALPAIGPAGQCRTLTSRSPYRKSFPAAAAGRSVPEAVGLEAPILATRLASGAWLPRRTGPPCVLCDDKSSGALCCGVESRVPASEIIFCHSTQGLVAAEVVSREHPQILCRPLTSRY